MARLSELLFQWQLSESLDITFITQVRAQPPSGRAPLSDRTPRFSPARHVSTKQDDPEKPGDIQVLVQNVGTVRDIVYESKRFKMTCTHTIVPGMIVEAVQGRHVDHISPEAPSQAKRAIAQFLNEYTYQKNGPLKLHFEEEINERGEAQGHPAMRDLMGANAVVKKRRASLATTMTGGLIKDKKAQEAFEISMSSATARKYSVAGAHVGAAPEQSAPGPRARRGSVTAADMTAGGPPGAGAPRGRRGSVVGGAGPMMPPPGRRGSVSSGGGGSGSIGSGRRASIIGGSEEHAGTIKYLVLDKATVRAGTDSSSPKVGEHKKGTVIDVIQESIDDRGLQVLLTHTPPDGATQGGWIKLVTSKGKHLLERIGSAEDLGMGNKPLSRGGRRGSVSSGTSSIDMHSSLDMHSTSRGGRRGSVSSSDNMQPSRTQGGRRGSVSSSDNMQPSRTQGGRRGSVSSNGSAPGGGGRRGSVSSSGRRGSMVSDDGSIDGGGTGAPLTSSTGFKVKYEVSGKKTSMELSVQPKQIVLTDLKTNQIHAVFGYTKLRTNNYARVVSGGIVLGLPDGKDMFLFASSQDATQISELVHRGKEHVDYEIDRAERREMKIRLKQDEERKRDAGSDEDDGSEAVAFDASPASFRKAFNLTYEVGETIDVDSEDGWEYGATVLGPATGGDDDEMQIRFADGVIDDWPIADFRRPKVSELIYRPGAQCAQQNA
jgi:hypothetical protein